MPFRDGGKRGNSQQQTNIFILNVCPINKKRKYCYSKSPLFLSF